MPEESRNDAESGWLLEPPGSGEVHVNIAIGSDVELSAEARAALETFLSTVEEDEVSGFALPKPSPCPSYRICSPYGKCQPVEKFPCFMYVHCRVGIA